MLVSENSTLDEFPIGNGNDRYARPIHPHSSANIAPLLPCTHVSMGKHGRHLLLKVVLAVWTNGIYVLLEIVIFPQITQNSTVARLTQPPPATNLQQ